jgi:hypothetical protein
MSLRLSQDQVILLHAVLIQRFGGAQGILNLNLLNSALAAPYKLLMANCFFQQLKNKLPDLPPV